MISAIRASASIGTFLVFVIAAALALRQLGVKYTKAAAERGAK